MAESVCLVCYHFVAINTVRNLPFKLQCSIWVYEGINQ